MSNMTHIHDWLDEPTFDKGEVYAKFVLDYKRMPAWKVMGYAPWMNQFELFCDYEGARYRVNGASRLGDVWLATDHTQANGYDHRVDVAECSNWGPKP